LGSPPDDGMRPRGPVGQFILEQTGVLKAEQFGSELIPLLFAPGGGPGGGEPPAIDPIIQGLLSGLPKSGEVWPEAERKLWLDLLAGSFKLIYKDKPDMNDVME
jgi:hypothetical protein